MADIFQPLLPATTMKALTFCWDRCLHLLFHNGNLQSHKLVLPGIRDVDKQKFEKYFSMSDSFNVPIEGTSFDYTNPMNTGGVSIKHFYTSSLPENNLNNHSIVTKMEYEGIKIIIPGLLMGRN
jgi:hypothetical protein